MKNEHKENDEIKIIPIVKELISPRTTEAATKCHWVTQRAVN